MLERIIQNPEMNKYLVSFETGETLFFEGDDSQDIYVLVSGRLDVIKGTQKIAEITEPGVAFGEMSFLLGEKRSATVKAMADVKTIRVPKAHVETFLGEFPEVVTVVARYLAKRLEATSQTLFGFKEVCDQLPDAVILVNKEGVITSWNAAAESLYGRDEEQMKNRPVEELFENPRDYNKLLDELKAGNGVQERVLSIRHPDKGTCFISTSITILYDGQHNYRGVLAVGRDVTSVAQLERRYRRARRWLIPTVVLAVFLAAGIMFGYPYFSKGYKITDSRKRQFRDDIVVSSRMLQSFLSEAFLTGDQSKTHQVLQNFLDGQNGEASSYKGLVLLDENKRVFDAYSLLPGFELKDIQNTSYSGISFDQDPNRPYSLLTLYRATQQNPMGSKAVEMAFELKKDDRFLGWLVFQVDLKKLDKKYNVNENDLKKLPFKNEP